MPLTIDSEKLPYKNQKVSNQDKVESQGEIGSIMAKIRKRYEQLKSSNPSQSQFLIQEITELMSQASSMPGGAEAIAAFIEAAKAKEQSIRTSTPTAAPKPEKDLDAKQGPTAEDMALALVTDVALNIAQYAIKDIMNAAIGTVNQDKIEVEVPDRKSRQEEKSEAVTEASEVVIKKYVTQYGEKALENPAIAEKKANIRDTFLGPQIAAQMDANRREKQLEKGNAYMQTQSPEVREAILEKRKTRNETRKSNDVDTEIVSSKGLFDSDEAEFAAEAPSTPKKSKLSEEQIAKLKNEGQAVRQERAKARSSDDDIVPLGSFFDEDVERITTKSPEVTKASEKKPTNTAPDTRAVEKQAAETKAAASQKDIPTRVK